MSEVQAAKRKEKCENCTKQVSSQHACLAGLKTLLFLNEASILIL